MGSGCPWQNKTEKNCALLFVQGQIQGLMLCSSVDAGMGWGVRLTDSRRVSCHWELCHPTLAGVSPPLFGAHRWPQRCSCCSMGRSDPRKVPSPPAVSRWSRQTSRCWLLCCHAGTATFPHAARRKPACCWSTAGPRSSFPTCQRKKQHTKACPASAVLQSTLQPAQGLGSPGARDLHRGGRFLGAPLSLPFPVIPWMPSHQQLQAALLLQNPLAISAACFVPVT